MSGASALPDPRFAAYRKDLADIGLAGQVIASHYAEPLQRIVRAASALRSTPSADGPIVAELEAGEPLAMLDCAAGWVWGYAGKDRRVGYVAAKAVGPA